MKNWSIAQVRSQQVDPTAEKVAKGILALRSRQHEDGSWGSEHPLDKVVATCQCTMALLCIGTPASDPSISKALSFLASSYVDQYQWGFWRVGPMLRIQAYRQLVEADLVGIERRIASKSGSPSPEQPLATFLAGAYQCIGEAVKAGPHLDAIVLAYGRDQAWFGSAAATSHALAVLLRSDRAGSVTEEIFRRSVELIAFQASRHADLASWEGRVTSTAYIAMNAVECDRMRKAAPIVALLPQAKNFLLSRQGKDYLWATESPPYGGDLEITEPDYYTAVALRGLVAICATEDDGFLAQVWYIMSLTVERASEVVRTDAEETVRGLLQANGRSTRRAHAWRAAALLLLLIILIPQVVARVPSIAASLGLTGRTDSDIILGRYGSYASLIALGVTLTLGVLSGLRRLRRKKPEDGD